MNELIKTRLFRLLSDTSQITNEELQNAYENFVTQVVTPNQSEKNYYVTFRMLNNTRIELVFLKTLCRYEQGKKRP